MDPVTLRMLGGADLLVGGAPAPVDTRKAIALAAYTAIEGTASRDTLCALLWPEADETRARSALRRTLSSLRGASDGEVVLTDRRAVALSDRVVTDVARFEHALAGTRDHGHDDEDVCARCVPLLREAVDLYGGPFLAGFSLRDAPDFDDWTRVIAEGLRGRVAEALERLSAGLAAAGEYHGATDAARRWVDLDPLHEPAYRNLMLISAWAGDRAGAIDAYRRCVAVLSEELGVAPIAETTEFYEAILDDDLPPAPGLRRRVRAEITVETSPENSLLGRAAELAALGDELVAADSAARIVLIEGEPWMGRTRLLEEFATLAEARGHAVLLARGYEAERLLPFGIVVQLLRAAVREELLDVASLPDWVALEIGRLLPELARSAGSQAIGIETRLFDAAAAAFRSAAGESALVVGVDDAEWIDETSLSLLSYLTHQDDGPGLLMVITTAGASQAQQLDILAGRASHIRLEPLSPEDIDDAVPDDLSAERLIEESGGVPVLIAEHLRGADQSAVAVGMQRYVEHRLRALTDLSAQVAAAAAVLGGTCDIPLLRATSGRSDDEVVDAADDLLRRQILRPVPGTVAGLGFTLHAMEQTIYESLSPIRRRLLHRRAADALAVGSRASRDAGLAAVVADHLRLGGSEPEAAEWYALAGNLAASLYASNEAESAYRSALALGHADPGEIQLDLGDVLLRQSKFGDALDAFQTAAAIGHASVVARAEHRLGDVHRRLGRFDQAEHHFALAEPEHPTPDAVLADWALLEHRRGDREAAASRARRAVAIATSRHDPIAESRARDILGIVTEDPAELERAVSLAGDDPEARMASLNSLAYAVAGKDDVDGAVTLVTEALELADAVGDRHRRAALLNHLADLHHRAGREEDSRAALTEAVRLFSDLQPDAWEPEVWLLTRW